MAQETSFSAELLKKPLVWEVKRTKAAQVFNFGEYLVTANYKGHLYNSFWLKNPFQNRQFKSLVSIIMIKTS